LFVDKHWSMLTDRIILAFKIGGLIFQAYMAQALARTMMAPALAIAGGGIGASKGLFKFFGKMKKRKDLMGGFEGLSGMASLGKHLKLLWVMIGPAAIAMAVLGAALAVVGFAAAALAAFFVKNWTKLFTSVQAAGNSVTQAFERVYVQGRFLFDMMALVGEALLGVGTGASGVVSLLGLVEEGLYLAADAMIFMTKTLSTINAIRGFGYHADAEQKKVTAAIAEERLMQARGAKESPAAMQELRKQYHLALAQQEDAESARDANMDRTYRLNQAVARMEKGASPQQRAERNREAAALLAKAKLALPDGSDSSKTPQGGVHVTNMYNQWDLRNTDPDRLMSAFLPKLEGLADKRTQGRDVQPQGI